MIEPALLAANAIASLTPYLIKGGEELAQGAAKDLWELIKKCFQSDRDKQKLTDLQSKPDDEKFQKKVEYTLEDLLTENSHLANELASILKNMPENTVIKNVQSISGSGNTGIQNVTQSTINIAHISHNKDDKQD